MSFTLKFSDDALRAMLRDQRDLAQTCVEEKVKYGCSLVCTTVANLIASTGTYGGTAQMNAMALAREAGFEPEFYGAGIRVSFTPPDKKSVTFGKGQKKSATA